MSKIAAPGSSSLWRPLRVSTFRNLLLADFASDVGTFMQSLFRKGAFQGQTPDDAYFVKCDGQTTQQADIDAGIVNILVGFAPLKPAEFVIIQISQMSGTAS